MTKIAFVILAAGESKRMGSIKQLLKWRNKSLLEHLIDKSLESLASETFVVLGAHAETIADSISNNAVQTIMNPDWESGMGSSIAVAAKYIEKLRDYSGILISLVDQPLVGTAHFNGLIREFNTGKNGIVATSHQQIIGVPAIFSSNYFNCLTELKHSTGAKEIIVNHRSDTSLLPCIECIVDLDTPEAYASFLEEYD